MSGSTGKSALGMSFESSFFFYHLQVLHALLYMFSKNKKKKIEALTQPHLHLAGKEFMESLKLTINSKFMVSS